jgi:hypothetical protein
MTVGVAVALTVCLTAGFASGAQAFTWKIQGTALSGSESTAASLGAGSAEFKTTIGGIPLELFANTLTLMNGKIIQGTTATTSGEYKFSGFSSPQGTCASSLNTVALTGEIATAGTVVYLKLSPASGSTLATLVVPSGCTVPAGSYPTKGKICAELEPLGVERVSQKVLFTPAIAEAAGCVLAAGGNSVNFTASTLMTLSGANAGKTFGLF